MHPDNSFLTLTYNDENLPPDKSISTDTMQKFWKKLRDRLGYPNIKYYAAGEYGTLKDRPHYHACLFGYDFPDKKFEKKSGSGEPLYTSQLLQQIWGMGNCWLGDVTFESACYVARYTLDKRYGKDADEYYARRGIAPERSWSSKGLAKEWFDRYKSDCYPKDYMYMRGQKMRPPAYYDRLLLREDPQLLAELKAKREEIAKINNSKINFDIREIPDKRDIYTPAGNYLCTLTGTTQRTVADLAHEAQMTAGRVDNER